MPTHVDHPETDPVATVEDDGHEVEAPLDGGIGQPAGLTNQLWTHMVTSMSRQIQQAGGESTPAPLTDMFGNLVPGAEQEGDDELPYVQGEATDTAVLKGFHDDLLGEVVPGENGVPSGLQPNAARGAAAARRILGFEGTVGGIGSRSTKSDHPHGNAIDLMTHDNTAQGWEAAEWFHANRDALGVTYIIFNGKIASPKDNWAWRTYRHPAGRTDPTAMHADHVHISFTGGQRVQGELSQPAGQTERSVTPANAPMSAGRPRDESTGRPAPTHAGNVGGL